MRLVIIIMRNTVLLSPHYNLVVFELPTLPLNILFQVRVWFPEEFIFKGGDILKVSFLFCQQLELIFHEQLSPLSHLRARVISEQQVRLIV